MFKLRNLMLLPVLLFACRAIGGEQPVATAVPADSVNDMPSDSPRLATDAPPTEPGLPPTWTPQPTESSLVLPQTSETSGDPGTVVEEGTAVPSYAGPSTNYVVKRGDTLAEICIAFGASISEVARINNITDWDHIEVGQVLIIPSDE
jgi:LysM repeat protein